MGTKSDPLVSTKLSGLYPILTALPEITRSLKTLQVIIWVFILTLELSVPFPMGSGFVVFSLSREKSTTNIGLGPGGGIK